jgi:hypothetical protein
MMKHIVHYRLSDGEIVVQHIGLSEQKTPAGCAAIEIKNSSGVLSSNYRVDPNSKQIVERDATEKAIIKAAEVAALVRARIAADLARTDHTQLPDYPISPAQRVAWATYRQALRDLSKKGLTGDQQLSEWPAAPDVRPAPAAHR